MFKDINLTVNNLEVYIQTGNEWKVSIEGEQNIAHQLLITVSKGVLLVHCSNGLTLLSNTPVRMYITTPAFGRLINHSNSYVLVTDPLETDSASIVNKGSGQVTLSICARLLEVYNGDAGKVVIRGHAKTIRCTSLGSGQIDAVNLKTEKLFINLNGSGNVQFYCSKILVGLISGTGDVYCSGSPQKINLKRVGKGFLIQNQYC